MAYLTLAALAIDRFGLGARPGDLAVLAEDPRGRLLAELRRPGAALSPALPGSAAILDGLRRDADGARAARSAALRAMEPQALPEGVSGPPAPAVAGPPPPDVPLGPPVPQRLLLDEVRARLAAACEAQTGLHERLVAFWANHFAVSVAKSGGVRATAGAFEREAIRPHVTGRFADMLWAAATHPTMLAYLDNAGSIGPASPAGQRRGRGLNENLGREILELHTLGVDGGYGQEDVTALARILTGWTIVGPDGRIGRPGSAAFNANAHEPGPQVLLGRTYADWGPDQLRAALADIARHPATGRHVALKLARHVVADDPPRALVDRLAAVFRDTDGDLGRVTAALIEAPEAWNPERRKVRSPSEFLLAATRLLGLPTTEPGPYLGGLALLGAPLWSPPGPNGFPDLAGHWGSPEGMKVRLDIAARLSVRPVPGEPSDLAEAAFGPGASAETRAAIAGAGGRPMAIALLLMAPEFQRR